MQSVQSEIELCRKEYKKQKDLEQIVAKRELKRPATKKWHLALLFLVIPILIAVMIFSHLYLQIDPVLKMFIILAEIILTVEIYIRLFLIQAVKCYQHYAKDETRRRCLCIPSCSEYAIISLSRCFPLVVALLKIRKRLFITCDGEEYKVDFPLRKMNDAFEKRL